MKKALFTLFCTLTSTLCPAGLFDTMSDAEKKSSGIEKLSSEEIIALEAWCKAKATPNPTLNVGDTIPHGSFTITAVVDLGHFVKLDNGLSYDIYSRSRKKTMAWKVGDTVELTEPVKRKSYRITNKSRKQTVAAKEAL